ncbi:hypothetical protein SAMN05216212_0644 [Microbulbifer yueqingensis]|uniref:Uncharacterized protein n=1 Tax=Microbulbifer yueqingensis TaxID=658219 RepID=A0A1G8VMN4_9GAMM|nr:hypothetical protein SAMN05216212_0644 [Microbulbifer yueqingensis]
MGVPRIDSDWSAHTRLQSRWREASRFNPEKRAASRTKIALLVIALVMACPLVVLAQGGSASGQLKILLRIPITVKVVSGKLKRLGRRLCFTGIPRRGVTVEVEYADGRHQAHEAGRHAGCFTVSSRREIRSVTIIAT